MRYKEELENIFAKEANLRRRFVFPLIAGLITAAVITAGSIALTRPVIAGSQGIDNIISREVSQDDIADAKAQRDKARKKAAAAKAKVKALSNRAQALTGELAKLNQANEEQRAQYEIISQQLAAALEAKEIALGDYIAAEENLDKQQKLFQERVSVMFQYQNKSTLEVLLESDSIAGFFTNMEVITLIADADAQAVDQMQIALDDAQLQKDVKLKEANDMQAIVDEKQAQLDKLSKMIGTTSATLDDVTTKLSDWEEKEADLEAESQSLDATIAALQAEYRRKHPTATPTPSPSKTKQTKPQEQTKAADKQEKKSEPTKAPTATPTPEPAREPENTENNNNESSGESKKNTKVSFAWPTASHTITSPFGYRIHPIYKTKKFHSGIDIGAGYGSKIKASAGGTVILVSLPVPGKNTGGSGYGNYLVIDHGNGYSTLYGHCRNIYVKNGAKVKKGQVIAEVGSTGTSSGPHLHFEVRINGERKNPKNYLP